jgi:choice-of-anchor C domain-containing protein
MRPARLITSLLFALAGLGFFPPQAGAVAANLVVNGSFEKPVAPWPGLGFSAGQFFGHWYVGRGSVDLLGENYWQNAEGVQSVDLSGLTHAAIGQKVPGTVGQTYTLSFALAGNPEGGPGIKTMRVRWEGSTVATLMFDTTGHSGEDMGWIYYSFEVTATSSTPLLAFSSLTPGVYGPALDDVSLTAFTS